MKESKLAEITKRKSKFKNIAEKIGVGYTACLGTTTVGAIGGAIYHLCTKDSSLGTSVGLGATIGLGGEALFILYTAFKSLDYSKTP